MTIKKFVKTGIVSTVAMLASNNTAFAESCTSGLAGYCLTDGNAEFSIVHHDVGGSNNDEFGMEMNVDGVTQVWVLDFMIDRTTVAGAHQGTQAYLGAEDGIYTGTNQVNMTGKDIDGYGTIDLGFELNYQGTDAVTLTQSFTFTNTSGSTLTDLSFLAFTDVTLGGGFGSGFNDQGVLTTGTASNPTGYKQWSNNGGAQDFELLASVDVPVDSYEVSAADFSSPCSNGDLCNRAYTDDNLSLSDSIFVGEEDLMMAARWLRSLTDGESFSYTQTFQVYDPLNNPNPTATPIPAAVWLFASGLLGLVGVARRKQPSKA